ncbi:hypothetical protein SRIMM317S_05688 [Streptomyces rimosus subsp. rimosus]
MLALLLATTSESLLRSNALKNVLVGVADLVAAAGFVLFGTVSWLNALPLALGLLLGSWLGPPLARSLPTALLRVGIALAGLALAVKLAVEANDARRARGGTRVRTTPYGPGGDTGPYLTASQIRTKNRTTGISFLPRKLPGSSGRAGPPGGPEPVRALAHLRRADENVPLSAPPAPD